ncbi:MAG TPA: Maf family protein [Xanthomonadales bacterium]|nr:Maf family protein [Xanthomonadales bacterium]
MPPLILASTSRYRRELLARLFARFDVRAPGVDESSRPGEAPEALAERLAREKAVAVARLVPEAVVIGSDQVVVLDGAALGKPGTRERAAAQLAALSGRRVVFATAVAVAHAGGARLASTVVPTDVEFRTLTPRDIDAYLAREDALDCAGSFKSEALGIALCTRITGDDPTALVGLPLIATATLLRAAGIDPLDG